MVDYSRYGALKVEVRDKLATVTMNRPDNLNAFDRELHFNMEEVLDDLQYDDQVNAVVLTGAGTAFSAGGDLKWLQARTKDPSIPSLPMSSGYRLINNLLNLEKPIIAAVNGHAMVSGRTWRFSAT